MNDKKSSSKEKLNERIELSLPAGKRLLRYALIVVTFAILLFWVTEHPEKPLGMISKVFSWFTPFIIGLNILV